MSDIVERLRNGQGIGINLTLCREAADELERLRAQVAALREALQKLITHTLDCEKRLDEFHGLGDDAGSGMSSVVCDARAALEEK